ncbi:MAG: protein kinase [Myxococcales bacterium]|nr:protein kinase [Myxococcales bacterium]
MSERTPPPKKPIAQRATPPPLPPEELASVAKRKSTRPSQELTQPRMSTPPTPAEQRAKAKQKPGAAKPAKAAAKGELAESKSGEVGVAAQRKRREGPVQLDQNLTIAKRIGKGRLGVVYAAVHEVLARRFAVKVVRRALAADEKTSRRLRHAVRETSIVDHPNVVALTDFGTLPDGRFYLTMEFVRGIQLSRVLERDGRFEVQRAVPLLIQLADALEAAHRLRVVHGDVKPSNVLLVEQTQGRELIKLHDFALVPVLSPAFEEKRPLAHLELVGSPDYLAPEQITGGHVDGRADIYAFGALAYRMLTGEPPFVGAPQEVAEGHRRLEPVPPSRRSGAHDVPADLDALLLRCLEKNPGDRFRTLDEVSLELASLMPQAAPSPFEEEVTGRWKIPPELEEEEEPLPESPARLRRLFYDTILELGEHIDEQGVASDDMVVEIEALRRIREEAAALAAQSELTENRFEDIRRELRERESALRYAVIDLNLAKSDQTQNARDLDQQISDLERSLAQLEKQRRERFAALNVELKQAKDGLKALEHQMAVHYRRLYAELDEVRTDVDTSESRQLFRRLERCRAALSARSQRGQG